MSIEAIFEVLSGPLTNLAKTTDLAFIGVSHDIKRLQMFFNGIADSMEHGYLCIDLPVREWENLLQNKTLIVSSLDDEAGLYEQVLRLVSMLGIASPVVVRLFADVFVNFMCQVPLLERADTTLQVPNLAYAIVGLPRCGTELLCEALRSTGQAGLPQEHFRSQSIILARYCHFDCTAYLRSLMSRRVTSNGVFGTKLISHFLIDHLALCPALELELSKLRFVNVTRDDIIDQAISAMLAAKTNVWHVRTDDEYLKYLARLNTLTINGEDLVTIRTLSEAFEQQACFLEALFKRNNIVPLTVKYEDLVADLPYQVEAVLAFLNIKAHSVRSLYPTLKRTHSILSESIRALYEAADHRP